MTLKRFPLIARSRPPCQPLPQRLAALTGLADRAADTSDQTRASAVYNQAALLASDIGLTGHAADLCREHAKNWLERTPLSGEQAIHALEPIVNLARLDIRAGHLDRGRQTIQDLYRAVRLKESAAIARTEVPQRLVHNGDDHGQVTSWLWRVFLAEGTRTFTLQGQWKRALDHLSNHQGVGSHMLDGRQVAIINALVSDQAAGAKALLDATTPGAAWEQRITACLNVLHANHLGSRVRASQMLEELLDDLAERPEDPGLAVFDLRVNLTVLDLFHEHPELSMAEKHLLHATIRHVEASEDGYAARDFLAFHQDRKMPSHGLSPLENMVKTCGLSAISITPEDLDQLRRIIQIAQDVLTAGNNQGATKS